MKPFIKLTLFLLYSIYAIQITYAQTVSPIPDQVIFAGRTYTLPLTQAQQSSKNLRLLNAPTFVKLHNGALNFSPSSDEVMRSLVTLKGETKEGVSLETSFQLTVLAAPNIKKIEYQKPLLKIWGEGFEIENNQVILNGKNISANILTQGSHIIILQVNKQRLNLTSGINQVTVKAHQTEQSFLVKGLEDSPRTNIKPLIDQVQNIQLEVGRSLTIDLKIQDETSMDVLTVEFNCDKGNFIKLMGNLLMINPQNQDIGLTTCMLKITDDAGLSTTSTIFVRVVPCALPLTFNAISNQVIKIGETRTLELRVTDPCGLPPINLAVLTAPKFVTFTDRGNGMATLTITPQSGDLEDIVIIEARDSIGLVSQVSFTVTPQIAAQISSVQFVKPNFSILGNGFGNANAQISINNVDVTARLFSQNDSTIVLRGNKKKLSLRSGPNLVRVRSGAPNVGILETIFTLQ